MCKIIFKSKCQRDFIHIQSTNSVSKHCLITGLREGADLKKKKAEVPKSGREPCSVFELQSINPKFAVLAPTGAQAGGPVIRVPLESLKEDWTLTALKAPIKIALETCNPEASVFWAIDYVKAKVIVALNVLYAKFASESIYKGLEVYIQSREHSVQSSHAVT